MYPCISVGEVLTLKIGIDGKFASSRYGGMGAYTLRIIEALAHLGQDDLIIFVPSEISPELELSTHAQCLKVQHVFTKKQSFQDVYDFRAYWEQEVLPAQLEKHAVDVFFGPAFMAPLHWYGPKVVTVHDLLFERSPSWNSARSTTHYRTWAKLCAQHVNAIIAVSHFTAHDISTLWDLHHVPVHTIYLAPSLSCIPASRAVAFSVVSREFKIKAPYLLYVGDSFPRKNITRLLQAYALLTASIKAPPSLVLVTAQKTGEIEQALTTYQLSDRVIVTGYGAPDILPHLYAAAEMLIFPSLFEGFGLPAIEAMSCGIPVITSKAGALPEVVADAALLIDPEDPVKIKEAMELLLMNEEMRIDLIARGKRRAQQFSWEKTARETRDVLARAIYSASSSQNPAHPEQARSNDRIP